MYATSMHLYVDIIGNKIITNFILDENNRIQLIIINTLAGTGLSSHYTVNLLSDSAVT